MDAARSAKAAQSVEVAAQKRLDYTGLPKVREMPCSKGFGGDVLSLLERCPHFRGWYVQASMELGPEDVSLLERCPHFRGWYVQASMELGPEDVSLLERCPHSLGRATSSLGWSLSGRNTKRLISPIPARLSP